MKRIIRISVVLICLLVFLICASCIISGIYNTEFSIIPWALIGLIISPIFIFRPEAIIETPNFIKRLLGREEAQTRSKEDMISIPKKYLDDAIEEKGQYRDALKEIAQALDNKDQDIEKMKQELQKSAELIKQYFWKSEINEFKYLGYFFVYNTKRILAWVAYRKQVSIKEFYKQAFFFGINVDNIDTTFNVLRDFYMIEIRNEMIYPTRRSSIFLDVINFKYPDFRTIAEVIEKITPPKPPEKSN